MSLDLRKTQKLLYSAPSDDFILVTVPERQFVMIDGAGDPNASPDYKAAVEWLYGTSYAMKFASKAEGNDFVVPPLEGLWWADDMQTFITRNKAAWRWTMLIPMPDFINQAMFNSAVAKTTKKRKFDAPATLRLERFREGMSLQILHVGSYDDEGPVLERLHHKVMPENGFAFDGKHHEIYLSDPRRTEPSKLKTILRQPVKLA